jgi:thiol-disulfide isomerase/thioredoxin
VVVAAAALALAACGGGGAVGEVGGPLPDVEITELGGSDTISLADIDGPAVINLWATWCPPCRAEIPEFEEVHQRRADEVRFIGVSVDLAAPPAIEFIDEIGATYEQFHDPTGQVQTELSATAMPVTVIIGADGRVSTRHLGALSGESLDAAIDDALS